MQTTDTSPQPSSGLYIPEPAKITRIEKLTGLESLFEIELPEGRPLGHAPGQFVQVSCLGIAGGESFPKPDETRWENPFVAEMALCKTDRGNVCRAGVFWNGKRTPT